MSNERFKRALYLLYIRIQGDMSASFLELLLKLNTRNIFIAIEL
jgi:hypothetical protein